MWGRGRGGLERAVSLETSGRAYPCPLYAAQSACQSPHYSPEWCDRPPLTRCTGSLGSDIPGKFSILRESIFSDSLVAGQVVVEQAASFK
ncbi:unnamed protein product [Boreogadus saida]